MNDGMVCVLVFVHVYMYEPQIKNTYLITKTSLFKYIENFTTEKEFFSDKKILTFFIFLLKT